MISYKTNDNHELFSLYEHMIRNFMAIPIPDKTTYCIMTDFGNFRQRYYENWDDVLKTIISDKDGVE